MPSYLKFNPDHYKELSKCLEENPISDWNEYVAQFHGQIGLEEAELPIG